MVSRCSSSVARSTENLIERARENEDAYKWQQAAKLYGKALLNIKEMNFRALGAIEEKSAHCLYRAAFQKQTNASFRKAMVSAAAAYEEAAETYQNSDEKEDPRASHCKAMAAYINSWTEANPRAKKRRLDESVKCESECFETYERLKDSAKAGEAYNRVASFLVDRLEVEWDAASREKIVRTALGDCEKALKIFSEIGNRSELAKAYVLTAFFCRNGAFAKGFDVEKRKECQDKAMKYPPEAMRISKETGDAHLIALSNLCLADARLDIAGSTGLNEKRLYEEALKYSLVTGDRLLIARALFGLEFASKNSAEAQANARKAEEEFRKLDRFRNDTQRNYSIIGYDEGIALAYCFAIDIPIEERYTLEASRTDKRLFVKEHVELGRKAWKHAHLSGSMGAVFHSARVLSWILVRLARVETDIDEKKRLLEESSQRVRECISILKKASALSVVEPAEFNVSNVIWSLALNQTELARIETSRVKKTTILKRAIANMLSARKHWQRWVESPWTRFEKWIAHSEQWIGAGITEMTIGKALNQLYTLANDKTILGKAADAFEKSIDSYGKAKSPFSRIAESYWHLAETYNKMQNYEESARKFESASKNYVLAAMKTPQLKEFYRHYGAYMQGWSEIEKARQSHARQEYGRAKNHYEAAARLHKSTKRWTYLAVNYQAWARLEEAENLSRKEKPETAKTLFQQAGKLFAKARDSIEDATNKIDAEEERQMAIDLAEASNTREKYCLGRSEIEQARTLYFKGEYAASAKLYAYAADTFQKAHESAQHESDRQELEPIVNLSQAWCTMAQAESEASSEMYLKASELFDKTRESSIEDKTKLLASGHSRFCRALEAGARFEDTGDSAAYQQAKKNLEAAEAHYLKAGFEGASAYAKATRMLFDAYMYMHRAETEVDPAGKARFLEAAERLLQTSTRWYLKAKHPGKSREISRLLTDVQEKRHLAMSLTKVLHPPGTASSTTSFSAPAPTHEQAVGLERFEHAMLEAQFKAPQETEIGRIFEVTLDIVNVAQNYGFLIRVDGLIPPGLEAETIPSEYSVKDGSLDMKGKKLEPLKFESIKLSLTASKPGMVTLSPKIVFVDDAGNVKTHDAGMRTISILPELTFQFKSDSAQKTFEFLAKSFADDYMARRMPLEKSGWRTLMQISRQTKIPKSHVYGAGGHLGIAVSELERRGLVETRMFAGERGRGGRILRVRVFYDRETVKRHIDERIMKIK